jgi:predicted LPLAT superfamily acyltransferase
VAIQLDRALGADDDLDVRLFGRRFPMPRGPFLLSSLTGAPLIPLFCSRHGYFDYHVHIVPPIRLPRRASAEEQLEGARRFADALEGFIRRYPTQWFHFSGTAAAERGSASRAAGRAFAAHPADPPAQSVGRRLKTPRPAEGDSL